jgi:hypothetical protein
LQDGIDVVRVVHGSRDLDSLAKPLPVVEKKPPLIDTNIGK